MDRGTIFGSISAIAVFGIMFAGWQYVSLQHQAGALKGAKEIKEEQFTKEGITSTAHFVSDLIDAPVTKVQEAVWRVEQSSKYIANFKASELVSEQGNTKVVKMQLQALTLPVQAFTMEFTLDADKHRVNFKTTESQAQDIVGWYQLDAKADGRKTQMTYHSEGTDKINIPFPQSVIEGALRETFVNTVKGITQMVKG